MSFRLKITLPDPVMEQLDALAEAYGEPLSRVAAQMVRERVEEMPARAPARRRRSRTTPPPAPDEPMATDGMMGRAPWLEPYGGDFEWRSLTWGGIVALYGRYPIELQLLQEGWWRNESQFETICALVAWREMIDVHSRDPREELAFQYQLECFREALSKAGGSVTTAWKPGAPPADWFDD